jgi:hypothetical protein
MPNKFSDYVEKEIIVVRGLLNQVIKFKKDIDTITYDHPEFNGLELQMIEIENKAINIINHIEDFFEDVANLQISFEVLKEEYGMAEIQKVKEEPEIKTNAKKRK